MSLYRVSTDVPFFQALTKFREDLQAKQKQVEESIANLKALKIKQTDEEINNLKAQFPQYIHSNPLPPIGVFSQPQGQGTKYRAEPDGASVIANSKVCYMFDDFQILGRNTLTAEKSAEGVEPPYVPPLVPDWELPAAKTEADEVDQNVQKVRNIFDNPYPTIPATIPAPKPVVPPSSLSGNFTVTADSTAVTGDPATKFTTELKVGDLFLLANLMSPTYFPDDPTTYIVSAIQDDQNLTLAVKSPKSKTHSALLYSTSDNIPFPALSDTASLLGNLINGNAVTPVSYATQIKDKTKGKRNATLSGPPPTMSAIPGPFGIGKGARFTPLNSASVQIEPIMEGGAENKILRQGPEMALASVIRPTIPLPGMGGYSLASVACPAPAGTPYTATKYSLQLVAGPSGRLFPRLAWQYFNATLGTTSTVYAQSMVPVPMPSNVLSGQPPSLPPIQGAPAPSTYFIGVSRWVRELAFSSDPFYPAPLSTNFTPVPNFDNPENIFNYVLPGDFLHFGNDSVSMLGTSSYQLMPPDPAKMLAVWSEVLIGLEQGSILSTLTSASLAFMFGSPINVLPPYQGNPPTMLPLPKPRKIHSLGVTFYIGDLSTGQFFIDDCCVYGTDEKEAYSNAPFFPVLNRNLPYPGPGQLGNLFIGKDPAAATYMPSPRLSNGVIMADIASAAGGDVWGVIGSGTVGSLGLGAPIPPSPIYDGDYYLLNIPFFKGNTKKDRDQTMTDMFNNCFADYVLAGKAIARSSRSSIPSGGTVYLNYSYLGSLDKTVEDVGSLNLALDETLAPSNNPLANSTLSVAAAANVPTPGSKDDVEKQLEAQFRDAGNGSNGPAGIVFANGQPYLSGNTPVDGFKKMVDALGYSTAYGLCVGQPQRSVLVCSIEDRIESPAVDSCGNKFNRLTVTERLLGIDISVQEAMRRAKITDMGLLILRLYWIGGLPEPTVDVINRLNNYGLLPDDVAAALVGESTGTIEVIIIGDQNVAEKLPGDPADIEKLFTDRNPVSLDLNPDSGKMAKALENIINSAGAQMISGRRGPVSPVMQLMQVVDLDKAFSLSPKDIQGYERFRDGFSDKLDEMCDHVAFVTGEGIRNTSKALKAYNEAMATALGFVEFGIGMAGLNLLEYVPCLTKGSPNMNGIPLNPRDLLDRMRADASGAKDMAQRVVNSLHPMLLLNAQAPILAAAVGTVTKTVSDAICVPRTFVEATQGGDCPLGIPKAQMNQCLSEDPSFGQYLQQAQDYLRTAQSMVTRILAVVQSFTSVLGRSTGIGKAFARDIDQCIAQASSVYTNILNSPPGGAAASGVAAVT